MITTANYLLIAKVGDLQYFFEYDKCDIWETLEQFWHEDYPDTFIQINDGGMFPIDVLALEDGKEIDRYPMQFNAAVFHAFFDHGHKADGIYTINEFAKDIKHHDRERNDVTSFFFYMWNAWCEEECKKAFSDRGNNWQHFWSKWCGICEKHSVYGAAERFYAELSPKNRNLLVERATEVYEGDSEKH